MDFAEWVVSQLDQLRLGQLPDGQSLFEVTSTCLGGDPVLYTFMNSGDSTARAELVQVISQAVTANPGFEQQLRQAAVRADGGATQAKPPFYKTRGGVAVIAVVCLAVIGGVVGLVTSGGSSGGSLGTKLQGQWRCHMAAGSLGLSTGSSADTNFSLTIGNGVYNMREAGSTSVTGGQQGTWKVNGGTLTLGTTGSSQQATLTGIPNDFGPFHTVTGNGGDPKNGSVDITGTTSQSRISVAIAVTGASDSAENGPLMNVDCTRSTTATLPPDTFQMTVPSGSMLPTLKVGQVITVTQVPDGYQPHQGDIIVFNDPGGWLDTDQTGGDRRLVKRVVGVPGDHVQCPQSDGGLVLNGSPFAEPYLAAGAKPCQYLTYDVVVPTGELWVLGDNRNYSLDSARHNQDRPGGGFVPLNDVIGVYKG